MPIGAEQIYRRVVAEFDGFGLRTAIGTFGAMIEVELVNEGPVTFLVFSEDGKILDPEA